MAAGYPEGLRAQDIPLLARIVAIVDAYDVMTHARSYKEAILHDQALAEIIRCSATQFDPELVRVFLNLFVVILVSQIANNVKLGNISKIGNLEALCENRPLVAQLSAVNR